MHALPPQSPPSAPWQDGLVAGSIAAAATAGALMGFGARAGTPMRPFNAIARLLLGSRAEDVWGFDPLITSVGLLVHVTLVIAGGVVLVALATRLLGWPRGWRLLLCAVTVALVTLALDVIIGSRLLHVGLLDVLAPGEVLAFHLVLAASLTVGMRLAHGSLRSN